MFSSTQPLNLIFFGLFCLFVYYYQYTFSVGQLSLAIRPSKWQRKGSHWVTEQHFNLINSKLVRECESIKLIKQSIKLGKQCPRVPQPDISIESGVGRWEPKKRGKVKR